MTLRTLFAIPIAVILLVTLALAGMIAGHEFAGHERGKEAIVAVERLRLLLMFQNKLWTERTVSNIAAGDAWPLPAPTAARLANARAATDQEIEEIAAHFRDSAEGGVYRAPFLDDLVSKLATARAAVDTVLSVDRPRRHFAAIADLMPLMLTVSAALDEPVAQVRRDATVAEPALSGPLTVTKLTASLREQLAGIARLLLPRVNVGEEMTGAERDEVRILLAKAAELTRMVASTIEIVGPTDRIRNILAELTQIDEEDFLRRLTRYMEPGQGDVHIRGEMSPPQAMLVARGNRVVALREAILDATVARVMADQAARSARLHIVLTGVGAVAIAILASLALLHWSVVRPLAYLGATITRIAAGDRSVTPRLKSSTREISEMVTAVETLRRAAVVADASATRLRMAAQHRLMLLREALGIVQTVEEPSRALERGMARLSEGFDATIALVTAQTAEPPPTLGTAANTLRLGLDEIRESAAGLDATIAAVRAAQTRDGPEEDIMAHILAMQEHVDRRNEVVRAFVHPSLVALRDASSAAGGRFVPALNELVRDQFERIEATVAAVSSMRASTARAATIVRELPLEEAALAA